MNEIAELMGERVLNTPHNDISIGMTLNTIENPTEFGSQLFRRCVTGCRVNLPTIEKEVCGIKFKSYGSHYTNYHSPYLNIAAAIGMTEKDISQFKSVIIKLIKHKNKTDS